MSQLDPNMSLLMASNSLAGNAMQPPIDDSNPMAQAPVLTQAHAEYLRKKNGMAASARPATGGYGSPLATHVQQAAVQTQLQNQQQHQQPPQQAAPPKVATPHGANAQPPREQDFNPAGVTLGQQSDGGRNVELIRGGQSEVQHFDAQGDNQGVLHANSVTPHLQDMLTGVSPEHAKALTAYAQAGATPQQLMAARHQLEGNTHAGAAKTQTFDQANQQQLFQYKDAERIVSQLEKKAVGFNGKMNLGKLAPAEQQMYQQAHQTLQTVGQKLASWNPDEQAAKGREQIAQQEVDEASKHIVQPQPVAQSGQQKQEPNIPKPPKPGTAISAQLAQQFIQSAGGDKDKARKLAKDAGWSF